MRHRFPEPSVSIDRSLTGVLHDIAPKEVGDLLQSAKTVLGVGNPLAGNHPNQPEIEKGIQSLPEEGIHRHTV